MLKHKFVDKTKQNRLKMVRSLNQWAKTLSFPARISPNRTKECSVNVHPITPSMLQAPLTPPRKHQNDQSSSLSASPQNVPITEISQIVSSTKMTSQIN